METEEQGENSNTPDDMQQAANNSNAVFEMISDSNERLSINQEDVGTADNAANDAPSAEAEEIVNDNIRYDEDLDEIVMRRVIPQAEDAQSSASDDLDDAFEDDSFSDTELENSRREAATAEEDDIVPADAEQFDTNLPTEHLYLGGANMNRVSGVNYLDVGQKFKMLLFAHAQILFPGEVLPFIISSSLIESEIDSQNGLLFGICLPMLSSNANQDILYGVTCQIYEKGHDESRNILIKSRALQRFVTKKSDITGPLQNIASYPMLKCFGNVKILPEIFLEEPLKAINMGSLNRFRDIPSMQNIMQHYRAAGTPWPAGIYQYYQIDAIIERARTQLAQHKIENMPSDPTQLSFWLIRNLQMPENIIKQVFLADSVNNRLKIIASTFKEVSKFMCRHCGNEIANCRELFAMSAHGVQTQYCNPSGYIHKTNTVYQVRRHAVRMSDKPSTEFSWFPGYQWQIMVCEICAHHVGWEFTAVERKLLPKRFFGLASSGVRVCGPGTAHVPITPRTPSYRSFLGWAEMQMQ